MAYSEPLADRIRDSINGQCGWTEKKMFGGLCFLLNEHMTCGIVGDTLMLRMGEERASIALQKPHTRAMDFTGRPLKGMIYVDPEGISTPARLKRWISQASEFVATLPPKKKQPSKKRTAIAG